MEKNWLVCREVFDFGLVCRGSKSLGNTVLLFTYLIRKFPTHFLTSYDYFPRRENTLIQSINALRHYEKISLKNYLSQFTDDLFHFLNYFEN